MILTKGAMPMTYDKDTRLERGFTLVELLVVIGILAVLISILLPAMARARQQAQSVKCMSNLHQLGDVLQLYANVYRDQIPLGYDGSFGTEKYWTGYELDAGAVPGPMGLLFASRLVSQPRAFYCPSQPDARWQYDTATNPWPNVNQPLPNTLIRVGYTSRPIVRFVGGLPSPNKMLPRMSKMRSQALVSDICGIPAASPDYTSVHHVGLNVLYGDRTVRQVARRNYAAKQKQIEAFSPSGPLPPLALYVDSATPSADALWNIFDRE